MRRRIAAAAAAALLVLYGRPASAAGTVMVRQRDGTVRTYANVRVAVGNDQMELTTSDGKGTLVLGKAACTKVGELLKCLPYDATLFQNGLKTHIALRNGTVWLNPTMTAQQLDLSSAHVPPHGVLMSINTKAGTYVSLSGTVDEIDK